MFVRPVQQGIVVYAIVHMAPTWTGVRLAFQRRISSAHQGLANVVEAVRGVVSDFLSEVLASVALLEVLDQV